MRMEQLNPGQLHAVRCKTLLQFETMSLSKIIYVHVTFFLGMKCPTHFTVCINPLLVIAIIQIFFFFLTFSNQHLFLPSMF